MIICKRPAPLDDILHYNNSSINKEKEKEKEKEKKGTP